MSELIIAEKAELVAIANAIREKLKSSDGITIRQMADLINGIESGGDSGIGLVGEFSFIEMPEIISTNNCIIGLVGEFSFIEMPEIIYELEE
jgi:hypothetical protein